MYKEECSMRDIIYGVITIGFFALMLAYVRGCAALGARSGERVIKSES